MLKRHEEEKVPAYVWVKPWLEGKFDIMKASISVVRKINYDGTVFSSHQEVQCMLKMGLITLIDVK